MEFRANQDIFSENYFPEHLYNVESGSFTCSRDILGVTRPIFVDSLDGDCHRAFGLMPNMSWIFTQSGVPVYKSDWSDARRIQNAIEYLPDVTERRRSGERVSPFRVKRLDFYRQDQQAFYAALERNGPKSVREFRAAFR